MTPEERALRLLNRLPSLLQAGTNFRRIFEAIGKELEVMEGATRRLLESRWYKLARGFEVDDSLGDKASTDLAAIGALLDLVPGRGESSEYFRRHITELVDIHAEGLTTARSILRLVSLVYLAEQPPDIEVTDGLAVGRFRVLDEEGRSREIRVELFDNPSSAATARFLAVSANRQVVTDNAGLEETMPDIALKARDHEVVVPVVHQEESGLDVIFLGVLKAGQTLMLRHNQPPLVDGFPANGVVLLANPTRFAESETAAHVYRFDTPEARFSICEVSTQLPPLLLGETRWHYRTMSRTELFAYIGTRPELVKYLDVALQVPTAPEVDLTFQWSEITPAACELRIPAGYVPPHYYENVRGRIERDLIGFYRDVFAALEYGRAAGIRATVGLTLPLETEVLEVLEGPMQSIVNLSFAEDQATSDELTAVGTSIEILEQIDAPDEYLTFGGIFNTTYFDNSRFE